jgi:hypothetical protein
MTMMSLAICTETEKLFAATMIREWESECDPHSYDVFDAGLNKTGHIRLHTQTLRFDDGRVFFTVAIWSGARSASLLEDDEPVKMFEGEAEAQFLVEGNGWQVGVTFVYPPQMIRDGGYHGIMFKG